MLRPPQIAGDGCLALASRLRSHRPRHLAVALSAGASLAASIFPPSVSAKPRPAHVRVETARLRSKPDESGRLVGLLDAGRVARVVDRRQGWMRVQLQTGTQGWVRSDLLKVSRKAKLAAVEAKAKRLAAAKAARAKKIAAAKAAHEKRLAALQAAKAAHAQKVAQAAAAAKAKRLAAARLAHAKKIAAARAKAQRLAAARLAALAARQVAQSQARAAAETLRRAAATAPPQLAAAPRIGEQVVRALRPRQVPMATPILEAVDPAPAEPRTGVLVATAPQPNAQKSLVVRVASLAAPAPSIAPVSVAAPAVRIAVTAAPASPAPVVVTPAPAAIAALPAPRPTRGERLVRTALTYRGTPYRFGARGNGAFDCSGFTSYLWRRAGAPLPRTAAQQYRRGVRIAKNDMQPGDLVFFKNTYKRGVSHVGVYVGDGNFVHASSGGRQVRVDSLSRPYYLRHWAGARRMSALARK